MRSEKLLLSLKGYIGDAVMAAPLLEDLEKHYGDIEILTSTVVQQVLWSPDRQRRFIPFQTSRKVKDVVLQARELRRHRFSLAVLVNHSFRSALVARMAGIRTIVGHATEGRRVFLSKAVPYDEVEFEAWSCLDLAKALDIEAIKVTPRLPVTEAEKNEGVNAICGAIIGVQAGARFQAKQIPEQVTIQVIRRLQELRHKVVLLGGAEESRQSASVSAALPEAPVNLVGQGGIRQALGALANLKLMIGSDTGLMHLAAASGCPCVTVFGPTVAEKWGHDYAPHQVLRASGGDMEKIEAGEIVEAALRVLQ